MFQHSREPIQELLSKPDTQTLIFTKSLAHKAIKRLLLLLSTADSRGVGGGNGLTLDVLAEESGVDLKKRTKAFF